MSRVADKNHGLLGPHGRPRVRPAEDACSTLVATDVPHDDARPGPDPSGFVPGTEAGADGLTEAIDRSSGDRAEAAPHRRAEFPTPTPTPAPADPTTRPSESWPTIDAGGNLKLGEVIFGRYLVKAKLGAGGMGSVWLVQHTKLGCDRALKIVVPRDAKSHGSLALFEREAWLSAQLNDHPNIADVHDADSRADRAYIEMDYVPGRSLDKILAAETREGRTMPLDWTARVLVQLCDLLQFAHDKGIIHRDLKPSNLMLLDGRPEGREHLKVLDFGIAKSVAGDPVHTYTVQGFTGTPPYASPEQVDGRAEKVSDLYSVGVILYELLTGRLPFTGSFLVQLAAKMTSRPPAFREVDPGSKVPAAVEGVVLRLLDKDPKRRPQSARELSEAFLAALPAEVRARVDAPPTASGTETARPVEEPSRGWRRRKRTAAVVGLLGLGTLLAVSMAMFHPDGKATAVVGPVLPAGFAAGPGVAGDGERPRIIVHADSNARFLLLPGGRFSMGAAAADAPNEDEKPAHPVYLGPYYLQETEVTFGQMEWFFETHRDVGRPAEYLDALNALKASCATIDEALAHPAVHVSRDLAGRFAEAIGGRLPTEAEFEYAARSGGKDYTFVWGDDPKIFWEGAPERRANLESLGPGVAKHVGGCADDRTEQGVFDLAGNVREWCLDVWAPYSAVAVDDPTGPPDSESHGAGYAIRGGSFRTPFYEGAHATSRSRPEAWTASDDDLGFRVAVPIGPGAR